MKARRRLGGRTILVALSVGVAVSLVATPAFAAAPTITSFSPTCGPVGSSVIIEGSGFQDAPSAVSDVKFNGTSATFTVNSNTQITATVPSGATTGPIAVTDSEGTATSTTNFLVSALPCISSFTPTTGNPGTEVTITGGGLTGATSVTFGGVAATTFTVDSDTQISATVPDGAVTGPIVVVTPAGSGTSSSNFTVTTQVTDHDRSVSLRLRDHLVVKGKVTSDFAACADGVTVKIQRKKGAWKTVKTVTTDESGSYRMEIRDRVGRYRALAPRVTIDPNNACVKARSTVKHHAH